MKNHPGSPFSTMFAALAAAAILLIPPTTPAAPEFTELGSYRGSDEVLLEAPDLSITEQDLLIFALQTRVVDPLRLPGWKESTTNQKDRLREGLNDYLRTAYFAERREGGTSASEIELLVRASRINAASVAKLIWTDTVIRDSTRIFPEDIYYYYLKNEAEFAGPATVTMRRLQVPMEEPVTTEQIDEARGRARELRQQAIHRGGLQQVLDDNPDLRVDESSEAVTVAKNSSVVDSQVLDQAFRLSIAQISQPIQTKSGFYLIEIMDKNDPTPKELSTVQSEIVSSLYERLIPQQYNYLLGKELFRAHASNRAWLYEFLPSDADILRVRDFQVTVEEFQRLFPEVIGSADNPNKEAIETVVGDIIAGEVISQDLRRKGSLPNNSFYERALEIGEMVFKGADYVRNRREDFSPTEEQAREYLAENREEIYPTVAKTVWRYEVFPDDPESLRPGELNSLRVLMEVYLNRLVSLAEQRIREREELTAGAGTTNPASLIQGIPDPQDQRVNARFLPMGNLHREEVEDQLPVSFEQLEVGEFTYPARLRDGTVASYYVSGQTESEPPPDDVLLELARQQLKNSLAEEEIDQLIEQQEEQGEITYHPELQ